MLCFVIAYICIVSCSITNTIINIKYYYYNYKYDKVHHAINIKYYTCLHFYLVLLLLGGI